jgi:hypothetical protein
VLLMLVSHRTRSELGRLDSELRTWLFSSTVQRNIKPTSAPGLKFVSLTVTHRDAKRGPQLFSVGFSARVTHRDAHRGPQLYSVGFSARVTHREAIEGHSCSALGFLLA